MIKTFYNDKTDTYTVAFIDTDRLYRDREYYIYSSTVYSFTVGGYVSVRILIDKNMTGELKLGYTRPYDFVNLVEVNSHERMRLVLENLSDEDFHSGLEKYKETIMTGLFLELNNTPTWPHD